MRNILGIHSYASPDGPYALKEKLSRKRTQALKEYVRELYALDEKLIILRILPKTGKVSKR